MTKWFIRIVIIIVIAFFLIVFRDRIPLLSDFSKKAEEKITEKVDDVIGDIEKKGRKITRDTKKRLKESKEDILDMVK